MNIWIIDHYAVPPKYYPLARQTIFAKKLGERGHKVTIFCASTVHNSDLNLSNGAKLYREETVDGVKYVFVTCHDYQGNGVKRILNMLEFARKLPRVVKHYEKPDAVLACSMTLQACAKGVKLAKKYGAKAVAQITDLWPETLVAYGIAGPQNPAVKYLRRVEKWIYTHADSLIFSMEGAYDYIVERHWERAVPKEKVHFINNGVDLEAFDYNKTHFTIDDEDLNNSAITKLVYVGSIRKVNNLGALLDVAKCVKDERIKFLIWGDGDERKILEERRLVEHIDNVVFKGRVDKKYIPFITSHADANLMNGMENPIFRFGISPNKLFDYFAAGRPIICNFSAKYNPATLTNAGIEIEDSNSEKMLRTIELLASQQYDCMGKNARMAAERKYNFVSMTDTLLNIFLS